MATLSVCDLCNANPKMELCKIDFTGRIRLYDGKLPDPPEGFKYKEDYGEPKKYMALWDAFGQRVGTVQFIDKPNKFSHIKTTYDLCESCFQKFILFFESIRTQYQLQKKEIEKLDSSSNYFFQNPFKYLEGEMGDQ